MTITTAWHPRQEAAADGDRRVWRRSLLAHLWLVGLLGLLPIGAAPAPAGAASVTDGAASAGPLRQQDPEALANDAQARFEAGDLVGALERFDALADVFRRLGSQAGEAYAL